MNKKTIYIINAILFAVLVVLDVLYLQFSTPYVFKTLASVFFVFIALFNFIIQIKNKSGHKYIYFMLIGLIFACAGDIALIDYFEVGAGLFAVGHILYFIAFCTLIKIKWQDLVCFVFYFGFSLAVILGYPYFDFKGMFILVIAYAFIICIMLAKATTNAFLSKQKSLVNVLIFVGALLFYISDVCLLFNVFGNLPKIVDIMCLCTYYPAQGLLASSVYFFNNIDKKENINE